MCVRVRVGVRVGVHACVHASVRTRARARRRACEHVRAMAREGSGVGWGGNPPSLSSKTPSNFNKILPNLVKF